MASSKSRAGVRRNLDGTPLIFEDYYCTDKSEDEGLVRELKYVGPIVGKRTLDLSVLVWFQQYGKWMYARSQ